MTALVALIPIILLFALMLGFKIPGNKSALITFLITAALGLWLTPAMRMTPDELMTSDPYSLVGMSVVEGILKAIFPILIIILMAIFSYNILVASKAIDTIKAQFTSVTDDKGILVLLIVWGFGGLLEGMAGFGTAVAIPAAILIGLGFKPMFSALVALIGNTVMTGFGSVGVPVTTLCNEVAPGGIATPQTVNEISSFAILQLSPLFILVPFLILMLTNRKAWLHNLGIAVWTGGISLLVQYLCARFIGPETPAIIGSVASIVAILAYNALFNRRKSPPAKAVRFTLIQSLKAWSVYIFILLFILLSGALVPPVNQFLKSHWVSVVPLPVIGTTFRFGWLSNAGLMLLAGIITGGFIQGLGIKRQAVILARTILNMRPTIVTIVSLIAMASVMNYTGMIAALAAGMVTLTGSMYPLFAPVIGAIGTFVTGSDTSSNILFGRLQANIAHQLGMKGTESNWLIASNTTGATGAKMISPQSIAIATASCDMKDKDDAILRSALPYAAGYIIIGCLVVWLGLIL